MALLDNQADVVVVGGGLAGISAAIELAEAGLRVTLLEARPWLGGATCSFARRGLTIDNGQHAFLRGCVAYRSLLDKLGVTSSVAIQDRLDLTVLAAGGQLTQRARPAAPAPRYALGQPTEPAQLTSSAQARLRRSGLPAPLHFAPALAGYPLLTAAERAKAAAAALALRFRRPGENDAADLTFGDWLASHGQDENAQRAFWDVLSVAALGLPSGEADLGLAAAAIKTVLARRPNADIGIPLIPLSRLHAGPAIAALGRLGCRILLGVRAAGCQLSRGGGYEISVAPATTACAGPGGAGAADSGIGSTGAAVLSARPSVIHAAGVVLAVPAWEAAPLVPAELAADAARWAQLAPAPVVSLHVIYASPVTSLPFAAVLDSPIRWVIDKTGPAGLHTGQYLAASVPAAGSFVDLPASRLRAELLPELERLFPAATDVAAEDFFITRERRAYIKQMPGAQRLRAGQPGLPRLALAGSWTATGWPDTMEGAVRSGRIAAGKVLSELAGAGPLVPVPAGDAARAVSAPAGGSPAGRPVTSLEPAR